MGKFVTRDIIWSGLAHAWSAPKYGSALIPSDIRFITEMSTIITRHWKYLKLKNGKTSWWI